MVLQICVLSQTYGGSGKQFFEHIKKIYPTHHYTFTRDEVVVGSPDLAIVDNPDLVIVLLPDLPDSRWENRHLDIKYVAPIIKHLNVVCVRLYTRFGYHHNKKYDAMKADCKKDPNDYTDLWLQLAVFPYNFYHCKTYVDQYGFYFDHVFKYRIECAFECVKKWKKKREILLIYLILALNINGLIAEAVGYHYPTKHSLLKN